ncbi:DUF7827 domain-containing protein [Haloarchaeobius sp. DT45]|uniref:DUF7827 domain-containing protein n=1 Tax=Haloarchaeobius sp. DT45 TaxID=3446116 RepID=UPI003F6B196C
MNRTALQSLCCLALLVVATAGAPAAAATAPNASFDRDTYETTLDQEVTLNLALNGTENATVTLGSEDAGFQMNVTVRDNTSDGQVELTIYTQRLGIRAPAKSVEVAGNDTVVSADGDTLGGAIDPGAYRLSASVNGTETDNATLSVTAEQTATATTTAATTTAPGTETTMSTETSMGSGTTAAAGDGTTAAAGDGDDSEGSTPGFGVGAALVALTAAVLLARRQ